MRVRSRRNTGRMTARTLPTEIVAMSYAEPAAAPPRPRHALGLPAGSVRAMLALSVLGVLWALVYGAEHLHEKLPLTFVSLMFLMTLILAHYFAAHGNTIGKNDA